MDDAEREDFLGDRIVRLIVMKEYGEAADLLEEYRALRRKQGKVLPPEERGSLCEGCEDREDCSNAREGTAI